MEHTCKNCGSHFTGKYCNACGEKVYTAKDKSIGHIFEEFLHFLTHFEGSFLTTLKTIFTKPGQLSLDYTNGIRKKYYKPTSLYLLIVVIYLIFPVLSGLNMPMKSYEGMFGGYPASVIERKMERKHMTHEQIEERYDHKSHTVSKLVLLIILPLCALVLLALYPKKGLFDHYILSAEINSFFLAFTFLLIPLFFTAMAAIFNLFHHQLPNVFYNQDVLIWLSLITVAAFSTIAFKRFYQSGTAAGIVKSVVFTFLQQAVIVLVIYKLVLFTIVMWLI